MNTLTHPLQVYLPGSCAQLVPACQSAFQTMTGGSTFVAGKIDQTGHLADAIADGAPADFFLSANVRYMSQLIDAGLIASSAPFARNALCILVRPDLRDAISGVPDLVAHGTRTLLCPSGSDPCGQYTVAMFERTGFGTQLAELKHAGTFRELGPDVSFDLLAKGEADAIIIYRSFASRMPNLALVELAEPFAMSDEIVFPAGVVGREGQTHPDANQFLAFLGSSDARQILRENDFIVD